MTNNEDQKKNKNSNARIAANNRYNEKAYDRINIAVPKGMKNQIKTAAEKSGESVNGYIKGAVNQRMQKEGFTPEE